ncbi:hypothetical protein [Legionella hackeliae]|uniref:Transmembrane protein n=1 Tax=Legionella hackeliae TaxID=449 RepID=A0A0A8US10_LEGHA|nr:hypothetical protein [Legionella hackeliae]KTD13166.1 hypothetical protein Lhac_1035 [Legionella hackeliae]CEK11523.1 protein of unknown function [Legionella hackeliae]STX48291.1 Uncharacterised protein [Legionella hackeliae]
MGKSLKKEFMHFDSQTQLYLSAYQDQDRRHQLFRTMYKALAILAALIPPVSLIFTIQATVLDRKKETFSLWKSIGYCVLFALLPIASGFMSWHLIEEFEDSRRRNDTIQKVTFTEQEFNERKDYFKQIKRAMQNLGVDLTKVKPDSANKNHKVIVKYTTDKPRVDVYMDSAQRERQSKMLHYGIVLFHNPRNESIMTDQKIQEISDAPGFFSKKHTESIEIIQQLETQYTI